MQRDQVIEFIAVHVAINHGNVGNVVIGFPGLLTDKLEFDFDGASLLFGDLAIPLPKPCIDLGQIACVTGRGCQLFALVIGECDLPLTFFCTLTGR